MINPLDLNGKRVLLTGASSGLGPEIALLISQLRGQVILVGRDLHRLEAAAQTLEGPGHRVESFDLTNTDEIPRWMKRLAGELGPIHGVVHCAGVHSTLPMRVWTAASHEALMRVNVAAGLALAKGLRQAAVRAPRSSLVYVSSVSAFMSGGGHVDYVASKGAIISMTRGLANELAREHIRVNCMVVGLVQTGMGSEVVTYWTPEQYDLIQKRHLLGLGQPKDVAHATAFLLSEASSWMTGTALVLDGGFSVF